MSDREIRPSQDKTTSGSGPNERTREAVAETIYHQIPMPEGAGPVLSREPFSVWQVEPDQRVDYQSRLWQVQKQLTGPFDSMAKLQAVVDKINEDFIISGLGHQDFRELTVQIGGYITVEVQNPPTKVAFRLLSNGEASKFYLVPKISSSYEQKRT